MRTRKTLKRLDEMLTEAMNGTFEESRYDETELSRLESRWKQYLTTSRMSMEKNQAEREKIKTLVSDISHQTKTPLANILLYAELLEEKAQDPEEKELARQILAQTSKLEFLIQSLVKMSRLETEVLAVEVIEYEFYVCINVRDQGIGIPEEERAQIFGRFYRGSQVQQEEGVGIGLYLAREILQRENGYIKVESKPGEGSIFSLFLSKL